jgi:hypothetical protein
MIENHQHQEEEDLKGRGSKLSTLKRVGSKLLLVKG